MFFNIFFWLIRIISILISVVFITLWERKVMGYIGLRKGPKKVSLIGLLQPLSDRIKLVIKELGKPNVSNYFLFWIFPLFSSFLLFSLWLLFYFENSILYFYLRILGVLCCSSFKVYIVISGGWRRNRKYSFLGSLRGSAQSISYEVVLIFIIFLPCIFSFKFRLDKLFFNNKKLVFGYMILFFFWLLICLAETKRSPFDFIEGERELVSGFNIEYGALQFVFLYLAEYGKIIFFSFFRRFIFFKSGLFLSNVFSVFIIFFFIWVRSTLPRFRYDFLMEISWIVILPFILIYIFLIFK